MTVDSTTIARKRARAQLRLERALESPPLLAEIAPAGEPDRILKGLSLLKAALRHPGKFLRGGVLAVTEAEEPIARDPRLQQAFRMTIAEYHQRYFNSHFVRDVFWMGVPALKMPSDMWIYQEIIHRARPEVIIEIGSHFGGTTLYLAHLLDQLTVGEVISIDISREVYMAKHPRIFEITGDCSSADVVEQVYNRVAGRTAMVIHDGDHSKQAVRRDLDNYHALVSSGQYFIIEDTIVDVFNSKRYRLRDGSDGPLEAIADFLRDHEADFEISDYHLRFLLSANQSGFLKCIR